MEDFAAIDFETANRELSSVCSVGVVVVREGRIAGRLHRLIRPRPEYYNCFNTSIHGMTAADTADAPWFPEVWEEVAAGIEGLPLVAHNSPFDEGCLRAAHRVFGMNYTRYDFYCTCRASRRLFGSRLPNHRLPTVAAHIGFDLRNHHHALADAEACAEIAIRLFAGKDSGAISEGET